MDGPFPGPLSGLRLLDITHYSVGPWACSLLGAMGADVIKVEPPHGDHQSRTPPPLKNGIAAVYIAMNMNKRCVAWDLHDEAVRDTVFELVRQSDILIENHRPGFLDRRGLSYEDASQINPRLIYCSSSGYGSRGPYKQMGSTDGYGQAVSGYASVSGAIGSRPEGVKGGAPIDLTASQYIVSGVLAALHARETTGRGQFVDTSQMQAAAALSGARAVEYYASGVVPVPMGSGVGNVVPSRAFLAEDKRYVNVSATDEATWLRLCAALGLDALARDARLQSNAGRVEHRDEIEAAIETAVATKPSAYWLDELPARGVPCGAYFTHNNLRISDQVREQQMLEDVVTPWGRVTIGGLPWHFSRTPGSVRATHVPGSDNAEIEEQFAPVEETPPHVEAAPATGTLTAGPLEGLRVVDLTQGYAGHCGMMLADLGATVTKVEPPEGDYLRRLGGATVGEDAAAFLGVNRSKQSVRLAWAEDARAREALDRLIARADVLITDLRAPDASAQGLDHDALGEAHPRLVLCSLTPYGDSGPWADRPATELEVQGYSAQWRYLGVPDAAPVRQGIPIGALNGAVFAFQGILAALYERTRSGQGQKVEVSQLGGQIALQSIMWSAESEPDEWTGHCVAHLRPPAQGYPTADRSILWGFISDIPGYDEAITAFCERLGISHILEGSDPKEYGWVDLHKDAFEDAFRKHSADEIVGWVRELGGNAVPYHTFESLAQDPQALALGLIAEYEYPGVGRLKTTGLAWEFSETPARYGRPPLLGEHTAQVLGALGLTAAEIAAIAQAPAVK
ncbi:MAG: CoA transferase [Dehalococcoidia bacterium]